MCLSRQGAEIIRSNVVSAPEWSLGGPSYGTFLLSDGKLWIVTKILIVMKQL